jgi:hypothetical protein
MARSYGRAATNQTILLGAANKPELYILTNTFKPGRFGTIIQTTGSSR